MQQSDDMPLIDNIDIPEAAAPAEVPVDAIPQASEPADVMSAAPAATLVDDEVLTEPVEPTPGDTETEAPIGMGDFGHSVRENPITTGYETAHPHIEQTMPAFASGEFNMDHETLAIAPLAYDDTLSVIGDAPDVPFNTPEAQAWRQVQHQAQYTQYAGMSYKHSFDRPASQWAQIVRHEGAELRAGGVKLDRNAGVIKGERAIIRLSSAMGMGSSVQIPLWHSGFWVTLRAPGDSALMDLNNRIMSQKIALARTTYGRALTNQNAIYTGLLMDFFMEYVYNTTVKDVGDVRALISSHDIKTLAWGLACTIWPRGFQYARAELTDPDGQEAIIRQRIRLGNISWTDTSNLTTWQLQHMSRRNDKSMTVEQLERYRSEFSNQGVRTHTISVDGGEPVTVELAVPSADAYIDSGNQWIDNIAQMYESVPGKASSDAARDAYVRDQTRATRLRSFGHWVKAINVGEQRIEDEDTLNRSLDQLSGNDAARESLIAAINKYNEDTVVNILAVPTEKSDQAPKPNFPYLIPIDPLHCFFILLVQRVVRIQAR